MAYGYKRKRSPITSQKGTRKRRLVRRPVSVSQVKTIARRVYRQRAEPKQHLQADGSPTAVNLYHNQSHCMFAGNNLLRTHHGLEDDGISFLGSRIGDEIMPTGIRINFLFESPLNTPVMWVRFILLKGHDSYLGASVPWHANALTFDNVLLNMVDTDKCTVLMNKVWKIGNEAKDARTGDGTQIITDRVCQPRKIWCNLKKLGRYTYRHDGSEVSHGKHFDIKGYLCAYDEFGRAITNVVTTYTAQSIFYFRDNC